VGTRGPKPIPIEERFWRYVDKRGQDECWEWTGCLHPTGYGLLQARELGRLKRAHVLSYEIHKGSLNGLWCLHKCDNRKCVNPRHLFAGTREDNTKDMINKGREASGIKNGQAKLNPSMIVAMRQKRADGNIYRDIAKEFGVSTMAAFNAINRKNWSRVR